eukprot:TRINITY_DN13438_c1_g4_i1.p1 TRINITY_DN13438_c1_g4~~TRINITY_DN13438_c1_g4_i1.p1  ORF type:complete len:605 (+),score=144.80 TRINITY_DN13438_c1_g4_i1:71-1816(+)
MGCRVTRAADKPLAQYEVPSEADCCMLVLVDSGRGYVWHRQPYPATEPRPVLTRMQPLQWQWVIPAYPADRPCRVLSEEAADGGVRFRCLLEAQSDTEWRFDLEPVGCLRLPRFYSAAAAVSSVASCATAAITRSHRSPRAERQPGGIKRQQTMCVRSAIAALSLREAQQKREASERGLRSSSRNSPDAAASRYSLTSRRSSLRSAGSRRSFRGVSPERRRSAQPHQDKPPEFMALLLRGAGGGKRARPPRDPPPPSPGQLSITPSPAPLQPPGPGRGKAQPLLALPPPHPGGRGRDHGTSSPWSAGLAERPGVLALSDPGLFIRKSSQLSQQSAHSQPSGREPSGTHSGRPSQTSADKRLLELPKSPSQTSQASGRSPPRSPSPQPGLMVLRQASSEAWSAAFAGAGPQGDAITSSGSSSEEGADSDEEPPPPPPLPAAAELSVGPRRHRYRPDPLPRPQSAGTQGPSRPTSGHLQYLTTPNCGARNPKAGAQVTTRVPGTLSSVPSGQWRMSPAARSALGGPGGAGDAGHVFGASERSCGTALASMISRQRGRPPAEHPNRLYFHFEFDQEDAEDAGGA